MEKNDNQKNHATETQSLLNGNQSSQIKKSTADGEGSKNYGGSARSSNDSIY